jgi:glyoxylase-like metal-dependent hydrolase (beta-lactamase superfamily II)
VTTMAANRMRIGDVEIVSVVDGVAGFPLNTFPSVTMDRWKEVDPAAAERGAWNATIGTFVVRTPRRTVMVDTGIGPAGAPAFGIAPGRLPDALREAGFSAADIDVVAITHMHIDHVGWNAREKDGKVTPTFPRARYYIARSEYDFWTAPAMLEQNPFLRQQAMSLVESGVAELYDGETRLADELVLIPTPGHTPAHSSISVTSGGEQGFILGDVAHHPGQVAHPDMRVVFDTDQDTAQRSREAMWQRIQELGARVAAGHFPAPGFGRIVMVEGKRMWQGGPT